MKCVFEIMPNTEGRGQRPEDTRVWRKARCVRSGCIHHKDKQLFTPDQPDKILSTKCSGLPLPHELTEWVRLFADAYGITAALAQIKFLDWRAKGSPLSELPPGVPSPQLPPPPEGPGTELKKIFAELGISPTASCQCDAMIAKMNTWGSNGCAGEHWDEIMEHLQTAYGEADILTKLRSAANAIRADLPLTLKGLVVLAIRRHNCNQKSLASDGNNNKVS